MIDTVLLLRSVPRSFEGFFFFVYTFIGCTSQQDWILWRAGSLYILQLLPVVPPARPNLHLACHLSQFVSSVISAFSFTTVEANCLEHSNQEENGKRSCVLLIACRLPQTRQSSG